MDLQQQVDIINLYNQYQDTDRDTIKTNLKHYMDQSGLKPGVLSKLSGIPLMTIYQIRKFNVPYKPDFIMSLIICNTLQIPITAILIPLQDIQIPKPNTKWTSQNKQQFIIDYNSLPITALCEKYNITPHTAKEYNRQFNIAGQVEE